MIQINTHIINIKNLKDNIQYAWGYRQYNSDYILNVYNNAFLSGPPLISFTTIKCKS
jgi:hypothetical protein